MTDTPKTIGRYEIRGIIGRGGMGVVYLAWDPVIGREIAIKCLHLTDFTPEQAREISERFKREAIAAGRLNHPFITTIFEFGQDGSEAFIAMEFVRGKSLDEHISKDNLMPLDKTAKLLCDIAQALDHAHDQGIVHRDVKPCNILVPHGGGVKITDFGIAMIEDSRMTRTGAMLGSPSYMSPEQILGKETDRRSDIFSLGVVLYIMLTGQKPFPGDSLATLSYQIVQSDPTPPSKLVSGLDDSIDWIISRVLAKAPEKRFQRAGELASAFDNAVRRLMGIRPGAAGVSQSQINFGTTFPSGQSPAMQGKTIVPTATSQTQQGAKFTTTSLASAKNAAGKSPTEKSITFPSITVIPISDTKPKIDLSTWIKRGAAVAAILAVFFVAYFAAQIISSSLSGNDRNANVAAAENTDYKPTGIVPQSYVLWKNASIAIKANDIKTAKQSLSELTLLYPEDAEAHLELGNVLASGSDAKNALKEFRMALQIDPKLGTNEGLIVSLASFMGTGKANDATVILTENIGMAAEGELLKVASGESQGKSRDALNALISIWQKELVKKQGDADLHLKMARALYKLKKFPESISEYSQVLKLRPQAAGDSEIIINLIELLDSNDYVETTNLLVNSIGEPAMTKLREVGPDRSKKMQDRAQEAVKGILTRQSTSGSATPQATFELALIHAREGDIANSVKAMATALDQDAALAQDPRVVGVLIDALALEDNAQAKDLLANKVKQAAVPALIKAIQSNNSKIRWSAATILETLGQGRAFDKLELWGMDLTDPKTDCDTKKKAAQELANVKNSKAIMILKASVTHRNVTRCGAKNFKVYLQQAEGTPQ